MNAQRISLILLLTTAVGCQQMPGTREQQATAGGAAAGAAAGAAIADNSLLGALIGGAVGAGGAQLIGAKTDWFEGDRDEASEQARQAAREAENNPATASGCSGAGTGAP